MASTMNMDEERTNGGVWVGLTHDHLNLQYVMDKVRSPEAGAIVIFAGTTRNNFNNKPVKQLKYTSYYNLAIRSLSTIATSIRERHGLQSIAIVHRLGVVPVAEESILIAVSSPHRQAAWRAGEEALEECKKKVEVWKLEEFEGEEDSVWRANRDGAVGVRVDRPEPEMRGMGVEGGEGAVVGGCCHGPPGGPGDVNGRRVE